MKTIRIFISSPGDVQDERDRARNVVHQLRRRYAGRLDLQALLWEELPLQADMSFQQGIDMVVSGAGVDIAVFILWSRLGSPTGLLKAGEQGRQYRSGTEREWDLMLRARERCQSEGLPLRPSIIVYTRQDEVSFEERLRGKPDDVKALDIDQKRQLNQFIEQEFRDAETGVNMRAYHSFDQPTTFAQQLRVHLSNLLDSMTGDEMGKPVWSIADQGPPFRGLDVFEYEHAPIFFGREDEIVSIRTRLREQACQGCAFVLISGPSGSGKSSLARAGVLPDVCSYEIDADIRQWRCLALKPNQLGDDILGGLVKSMSADGVLPELKEWASDIVAPNDSASFREWLTRFGLRVGDALNAAGGKRGATRLIVLVDQMEELFSTSAISDQSRQQLFDALEVLARSGSVWVLATVRSDFYHLCQTLPALVRMMEGAGVFNLLPPTPDALSRVITGPALLAGLRFEREGEQTLSDAILREAAEHKELLPLVEHLLLELCEHRSEDETLTFAHFRRLGGVEGALRQRCEETFDRLSTAAQGSLDEVLSELVTISGDGQETFVRRTVPLDRFAAQPVQRELIDAMVAARLFTASSGSDGDSVVSVAHEALLRVWPRVTQWIISNRDHLRLRARVEQNQQRWEQQDRDDSLLLAIGLPMNEARQLLGEAPHLLSSGTRGYIEASVGFHDRRARQVRRTRMTIAAAALVLMSVGGWFAWKTGERFREEQERTRVQGLVAQLTSAEPGQLPEIVRQLDEVPQLAEEFLAPLLQAEPKTLDDRRSQLHARLALVGRDASLVDPLVEEWIVNKVAYIGPIRELLQPYAQSITERLQAMLGNTEWENKRRFRAGVALAGLAHASYPWSEANLQFIASELVAANAEYQPVLRENLRPIAAQMLGPIEGVFKDADASDAMRLSAANAVADFAADQAELLTRLLVDATPEQFEVLYPLVESAKSEAAIGELKGIASGLPPDDMGSVERIKFGQRRANAAVSMLRLGARETVLPVFEYTDDPEALTQFIFRCRPRGIGVESLLHLLQIVTRRVSEDRQTQARIRYALLLALGKFTLDEVPESRREALIEQLSAWYANDPSSGVHGASGWLLRQWGQADIARKVDQTPVPYSPEREWFTLAITVTPTSPPKPKEKPAEESTTADPAAKTDQASAGAESKGEATEKQDESASPGSPPEVAKPGAPPKPLSPKTFYYTFIVFPAGDYEIGSVADQTDRQKEEIRHAVTLTRPFAFVDREITFEELIAFSPQYADFMQGYDAKPTDAGFAPNWYDSVAYCRWLGKAMGLPESDQCYADPETLDQEKYARDLELTWAPRNWPLDLDKRGFRLPTESEWELVTRSGSRTSYGFGSEVALLDRFGWFTENSGKRVHPPRELRPSVRGLFDLHGNLSEWTHDWYGDFGESAQLDPLGAKGGSLRVLRGGSWDDDAAYCRSARRSANGAGRRTIRDGFRLALSPSRASQSAEPGEYKQEVPGGVGTEGGEAEPRPEQP